jgi:hypothetical protein
MTEADNEVIDSGNRIKHVRQYYTHKTVQHHDKMKEFFTKSNIYQKFV